MRCAHARYRLRRAYSMTTSLSRAAPSGPFSQAISFFSRSHSASTTIGAKNATAARNRVIATRI